MRLIAAALACSALAAALSAHATIVPAESSWTESVWATNDFAHTGLAWARGHHKPPSGLLSVDQVDIRVHLNTIVFHRTALRQHP